MSAKRMSQKLTIMDVIKGLLFCFVILLFSGFLFLFVKLFIEDNILNIENPSYAIIGGGLILIIFGLIIGFSKVRQAGYSKNIVAELLKIIKSKK